jgi:pSer/pThr/pTyr-binding forkhead associated (FHA) protein
MDVNLVLLKRDGVQKAFPLPGDVTVLGRRHDCDLRIPVPTVSRRHCQVNRNGQVLKIRDLDSKGGTFVNGERVDGEIAVKAGDTLRVGPVTFVCQDDGQPEKIAAPKKAKDAAPAESDRKKPAAQAGGSALDDSFADLDVSDSFIELDESDSELDDLKNL